VVEAPSGRIIHTNARARQMTERQLGRDVPEMAQLKAWNTPLQL